MVRTTTISSGAPCSAPFRALIAADAISMTGNALAALAIPWFVLETTGSATRTGLVAAAGLIPVVVMSFLGGAIVDRFPHRRVSVVADLVSLVALGLIPLLHLIDLLTFPLLLLLVLLGALLDTPGATARAAILPDIARLAGLRLERANAVHEVAESGAGLAGPVLAGVLIAVTSPSLVLWLDAASFLVSAALIWLAVPVNRTREQQTPDAEMRQSVTRGLRAGMRFILHDGPIRSIFLSATVLNLLISPLLAVVLPYHARTNWDDAAGLGLVIGAFGAGAVAGAIVYGMWGERMPRRLTFVVGVFAIGGGFVVVTLLPPMPVMAIGMLLAGLISGPNGPLISTVLQERTPEHLRGRVFGATNGLCFAAAPIGVLAVGWAIEYAGVQPTLIVMTAIFLSVAVALACDSALRSMDARERSRSTEPRT